MLSEDNKEIKDLKTKNQEEFNAMPFEQRLIACESEIFTRMNDLRIAKKRLKENYLRELEYLNEKMVGYQRSLMECWRMKVNP